MRRSRPAVYLTCLLACSCAKPEGAQIQPEEVSEAAPVDPGLAARLERLDRRIADKREALGIPGLGLVVVKGGEVIYSQGHGQRDLAAGAPVDGKTLFAIGSTTKAFTAMLVMMAVEEGKLSLDDSPKTCLPAFKLQDPEADAAITVRDLLIHSSGLMRTDIGWYTGALTSEEVIALAGLAEPVDPLGEAFHYQNVMYLAAGECVAAVYGMSYEALLAERILEPLAMTHGTNVSVADNLKSPERAVGYAEVGDDEHLAPVPMRPIDHVAPAGALNSNLEDISRWLMLLVGGGELDGQRLISERGFRALTKRQHKVGAGLDYGLGWMRNHWRAHRQIWHTGGIDGFVTLIAFLPKDVAFALFTNVQNADIHGFVTEEVFSAVLDEGYGAEPGAEVLAVEGSQEEAGQYGVIGGIKIDVTWQDGQLFVHAPMQPAYPLVPIEGRRYRLDAPAPAGFFATFRPREDAADRQELVLEQPQGDMRLRRLTPQDIEAASSQEPAAELAALMGVYKPVRDDGGPVGDVEVGLSEGRVALLFSGQPGLPLRTHADGDLRVDGVPDDELKIRIVKDDKGELSGLVLGDGEEDGLELRFVSGTAPPRISAEALMKKVMKAHGSKRLAKHKTVRIESSVRYVNQGLTSRRIQLREAPNHLWNEEVMLAFDREIGTLSTAYDGERASELVSFVEPTPMTASGQTQQALMAVYDPIGAYAETFERATVKRSSKLEDEEVIVIELAHASGAKVTYYVSKKTDLILREERIIPIGADGQQISRSANLEDYRKVSGVMLPHKITSQTPHGELVETVTKVEFSVPVTDGQFRVGK